MCPNRLIEIMCAMSSLQQQQEQTQNMYVHNQIVRLFIFCYPRPKLFTRLPAGKKWMKRRKRATLKSWPQSPWICLRLDLKFTIKSLANRHSQPDGTEENRKREKGRRTRGNRCQKFKNVSYANAPPRYAGSPNDTYKLCPKRRVPAAIRAEDSRERLLW